MATLHRFTLIRVEEYPTPNQARNLALEHVDTPYVVFVDNDVLVSPGWLEAMVDRADQTDAWAVGPLYFEFEPEGKRVHMFGGTVEITDKSGERTYEEIHDHAHRLINEVDEELSARPTDLIEFHSVLLRMSTKDQWGPLDEGFQSNSEHGDLCLQIRQAGGSIWLEPRSQITYAPPKSLLGADRDFFLLRWSEARGLANRKHLAQKYNIALHSKGMRRSARWLAMHRRYSLPWLPKLRRIVGPKMTRKLEKWFITPIERWANRRRHPLVQCEHPPKLTVMVYSGNEHELEQRAAA